MKQCIKCSCNESNKWYTGPVCKACYMKQYKIKNLIKLNTYNKDYYTKNKEKIVIGITKYRKKNKEKLNKVRRSNYCPEKEAKNRINKKQYYSNLYKQRYQSDPLFKLKVNLRNRLNMAIKKQLKTGSAIKDLGCSIEELKRYLESQFESWMNWDNWGKYDKDKPTWNIDHIKALTNFDLTDKEQLKEACNYKNLRPLLAKENLKKGSKE